MEEGKEPQLHEKASGGQPPDGRKPGRKKSLVFVLVGIIVLLVLLLVGISVKGFFLPAKTLPDITLELVKGPELEESGLYLFEVEAVVSGNPSPEVAFNRDDGLGTAGKNRVVILLNAREVFLLIARAENSQGVKEAFLELAGGEEASDNGEDDSNGTSTVGIIEGYLVYPSDHIPDMMIVAEDVNTGLEYVTDEIIQDSKYATGFGFVIQVPPGDYQVYAILPGDDFKAYYDEYMQSSYTLDSHEIVIVSISEGEHVDRLVVGNWWKAPPNQDPVITGITVPGEPLFSGETYTFTAQASDPDGDFITFDWEVSGAGFPTLTAGGNPMTLTTTEAMQSITIKVTVRDGRGGEAMRFQEAFIHPVLTLVPLPDESGYIVKDTVVYDNLEGVYAGDNSDNKMVRAFISFNTEFGIGGDFTVHKAVLRLASPGIQGDPSVFHGGLGLWVGMVDWGARRLELSDFYLPGTGIKSFADHDINLVSVRGEDSETFAKEIEERLYLGADRLQIRLHFAKEASNNNNDFDGVSYRHENIVLKVYMTLDS